MGEAGHAFDVCCMTSCALGSSRTVPSHFRVCYLTGPILACVYNHFLFHVVGYRQALEHGILKWLVKESPRNCIFIYPKITWSERRCQAHDPSTRTVFHSSLYSPRSSTLNFRKVDPPVPFRIRIILLPLPRIVRRLLTIDHKPLQCIQVAMANSRPLACDTGDDAALTGDLTLGLNATAEASLWHFLSVFLLAL